MENTVHVLVTKTEENDHFVQVFTSKQAVVDYVKDEVRRVEEELNCDFDEDEDAQQALQETLADAENALNTNGWWQDADNTVYIYSEKEYVA